ncbi:MAG: type II toxin-antitoxin system VapC family toxin [Deltaproteobacteria bacterium]|nr:type II toxin-antitoxin system VapC family toxin [Deltaproteobacteria bacterium]
MKPIFVDTSALYAYLVATDVNHPRAKEIGQHLLQTNHPLLTHSFSVCEAVALLHFRIGLEAVRQWEETIRPLFEIVWVNEAMYTQAMRALLTMRRAVSLVDAVSFEVMRARKLTEAFAFDADFQQAGFALL